MATNPTDLAAMPKLAPINSLRRQIDEIFADFTKGLGFTPLSLDEADYEFHPSAELHDDGSTTTIRVELPGIDAKDITLEVTDDTIEISGEKKSETEAKDGDRYRTERTFGSFYRAFALPFSIDADTVDAAFDKGVLTIKVPTPAERPGGKKVAIKA